MVVDWDLLAWKEMDWGKHGKAFMWSMNYLRSHFWLKAAVDAKELLRGSKGECTSLGQQSPRRVMSSSRNLWASNDWKLRGSIIGMIALLKHTFLLQDLLWPTRQQLFSLAHNSCSRNMWPSWGWNLWACLDDLTLFPSISKMLQQEHSAG